MESITNHIPPKSPSVMAFTSSAFASPTAFASPLGSPINKISIDKKPIVKILIDNKSQKFQAWKINSKVLERSAKYKHQLDDFITSAFNNSKPKIEKTMMSNTLSKTSACFLSSPREIKTTSRSRLNEGGPVIGQYDPNLNSVKPRNIVCAIKSPPALSPLRTPQYIKTKDRFKYSPDDSFMDDGVHNGSIRDDKEKDVKPVRVPDFSKQLARFMINS